MNSTYELGRHAARALKPYPAYKDSRIAWLGEVPEHWQVRRLKTLCSRSALYGANVAATSYTTAGVRFLRTTDITEDGQLNGHGVFLPQESVDNYLLADGDVLISRSGTIGRSFLYERRIHGPCAYAGYLVRFVPAPIALPKYILLFTKTHAFAGFLRVKAISSTIENVNGEKYANCPLPLPPHSEQAAIVRFLDHADRRIRRYIRAKQKLIALLEEQKQAIIHQAVTGQIDIRTGKPYQAYKPSGVEWLGDVPEHWEVKRVKQAAQVLRGKFTHRPRNDPSLYDGPYPFIQTGEVARAERAITSYRQTLNERGLAASRLFSAGTLVMTIAANIGDVAVLDFEACFPDSVVGFVPRGDIERDFLYYVFRAMRPELLREAPVNTQGNLNIDRIGSRGIAVAPAHEQRLIARQIEASADGLNTATNRANREIELLREYRTRLIADVVTGKLDVRAAAAGLPEVDPLAAEEDDSDDGSNPEAPLSHGDEVGVTGQEAEA